ncbi:Protein NSP-INTERACTING KINASE 2 [Cardamine amara subsp. amara]|uniref:Protein NSP-INTERACTING KINASE 2 n=1 Tax=Cardamine amara subsp. amara TaxID=228776 RepID=A0ABD1BYW1_CARAN
MTATQMLLHLLLLQLVFVYFSTQLGAEPTEELKTLMEIKTELDPEDKHLASWSINGDPCKDFEGIGCDWKGQVSNISLQGKALSGKISPNIAKLKHLTGLFLHYNALVGDIPRELGNLSELTDLYLNVNNLSGEIPSNIGKMEGLQVLQLCYNNLTGSIPSELGSLKKLSVLALQSNKLTGAIPASLGDLNGLERLDLSYNRLFGSVPAKLASPPLLRVLDIRNNSLSGNVPLVLKRLDEGFVFENNLGLCGAEFSPLRSCNGTAHEDPKPYSATVTGVPSRDIPESSNLRVPCNGTNCNAPPKSHQGSILIGLVVSTIALSAMSLLLFTHYRRRKQKLSTTYEMSDTRVNTIGGGGFRKNNGSPLASLEYSNSWDPLSDNRNLSVFAQEVIQSFRFNLEEVETATQYFSEVNLLGRSNFSATYKGILRDGSLVAIKRFSKTSCKSEEPEFLKGLNMLATLKHENLARLRGFCCSKGRGECFLIYDFAPNGNLLSYLDLKDGDTHVLDWSTRVSIAKGIAKGIAYLHSYKGNKPALVHQNISAEKVLIDQRYNPLLSNSGLHTLLTNDIIFSALKDSAAMGYLAPEYTNTGRFTEKSDVYAFGVLVFQIISGKQKGRYFEYEATKLARIAWLCTHESPIERPSMEAVVLELGNCSSCL